MPQAYKIDVLERIGRDGADTWLVAGERIQVDGRDMVRLSHGAIVPADGFSSTEADARIRAALKVEGLARRLADQAERLRVEAAKEGINR